MIQRFSVFKSKVLKLEQLIFMSDKNDDKMWMSNVLLLLIVINKYILN